MESKYDFEERCREDAESAALKQKQANAPVEMAARLERIELLLVRAVEIMELWEKSTAVDRKSKAYHEELDKKFWPHEG